MDDRRGIDSNSNGAVSGNRQRVSYPMPPILPGSPTVYESGLVTDKEEEMKLPMDQHRPSSNVETVPSRSNIDQKGHCLLS